MSEAAESRFACEGCGASYRWKPELAGKRAKCKCGNVIEVPATAPEPPAEDLYALVEPAGSHAARSAAAPAVATQSPAATHATPMAPACPTCSAPLASAAVICVNCGHDLRTGGKVAPVPAATPPRVGLYPGQGRKRGAASEPSSSVSPHIVDLYLPIGLLVVGTATSIWCLLRPGTMSIGMAIGFFLTWVILEALLVFGGCLIGIKWMEISLGEPVRAILKIGAIVVGPFGLAMVATSLTGTWIVGFIFAAILYYVLFSVFFDLDMGEVLLLSGIIYAVQHVGRILLLMVMLQALFGRIPPAVGQLAGVSLFGGPRYEEKVDSTVVQGSASADDKVTADLLKQDPRTQEAREFLSSTTNNFIAMSHPEAVALVQDLYAKGAVKVMANDVNGFASANSASFTASVMLIELPTDPAARKALVARYNEVQVGRGYKEARDVKQKYLRLWTIPKLDKAKAFEDNADPGN